MKILITSDAHGRFDLLEKVHNKYPDITHHIDAGDLMISVKELESLNLIAVKGNSDFYLDLPRIQILNVDNLDILVVHGHEHNVKYGLDQLLKTAESYDVDLCIYGHTHQKQMIVHKGITYINPGAISGFKGSYCIYDNGKVTFYEV